jgi:hypothetical protein
MDELWGGGSGPPGPPPYLRHWQAAISCVFCCIETGKMATVVFTVPKVTRNTKHLTGATTRCEHP